MSAQEVTQTPPPLIDTSLNVIVSRESSNPSTSLKRRASSSFEGLEEDASRKRIKEDNPPTDEDRGAVDAILPTVSPRLVDDLAQELQCGCCSELVYKPVIVNPCQHFFCGSCCALWIRNGGTNCPACRGHSTVVTPFRAIQSVIDSLLRAAPYKARTERERQQADEIYKLGQSLRIPPPREPSPDANVTHPDFARPCPYCVAGHPSGWRCPHPIADPDTDIDRAWHLEDGTPPGHSNCGNCESLLATQAPTTTKCDLCQVYFCGIGVQGRCLAATLLQQQPHQLSTFGDMIMSTDLYECFDNNNVEVEIMLDYLASREIAPRRIYREIIQYIQSQPRGFKPLIEAELFSDIHAVPAATNSDPSAPHNNICRPCAFEVFLWGIKEWWVRERQKDPTIMSRKDCQEGRNCDQQTDLAHAKEFNHIFPRIEIVQQEPPVHLPEPLTNPTPDTVPFSITAAPTEPVESLVVSDARTSRLWTVLSMDPTREFPIGSGSINDLA